MRMHFSARWPAAGPQFTSPLHRRRQLAAQGIAPALFPADASFQNLQPAQRRTLPGACAARGYAVIAAAAAPDPASFAGSGNAVAAERIRLTGSGRRPDPSEPFGLYGLKRKFEASRTDFSSFAGA